VIARLLAASLRRRANQLGLVFLAVAVAAGTCAGLAAFASRSRARLQEDLARFGPNLLVRGAPGAPARHEATAVAAVRAIDGVEAASGVVELGPEESPLGRRLYAADEAIGRLHPNWQIEPRWPRAGERALGAALPPELGAGRVRTGEPALDAAVFVSLSEVAPRVQGVDRVEVRAAATRLGAVAREVEARVPGAEARPLLRVSLSDASLARRIEWLLACAGLLSLMLALASVAASTAALVVERRTELALMLALGHPARRLLALLAAELLAAAAFAALLGALAGELGAASLARRVLGAAGPVSPWAAAATAAAAAVLVVLGGLAAALRGIARLDPAAVLRGE
jgi:putative ABC transport system permease protein